MRKKQPAQPLTIIAGRILWRGQTVGYVEGWSLYGISRDGSATRIGDYENDAQAVSSLREWWNNVR
jgi:hypothetical protein